MGENIKLVRKRRRLTVGQKAGFGKIKLYQIEKGKGSVSMATYFNTLRFLGLEVDFLKLASDTAFGRKRQDLELLIKNSHANDSIEIQHLVWFLQLNSFSSILQFSHSYILILHPFLVFQKILKFQICINNNQLHS